MPSFAPFKNAEKDNKPFLAGVDPAKLDECYKDYKTVSIQLDIDILEMLSIVFDLAAGKERPNLPIYKQHNIKV